MFKDDLEKYEGKVALLDLVSGLQVTTEITHVGTERIECNRPIIFQITTEPADPSSPPSANNPMQQKLNAVPMGGPFTHPPSTARIDFRHIIAVYDPIDAIEKAYLQATSGIQLAGADAISQLDKAQQRR